MEPVLFKERNDGHGDRGAGLLGVLSGASSTPTTEPIAVQPKTGYRKGLSAEDGSKVPAT